MLLFERRRPAAGGALLAYAIVSKLFPGVLVLYLLLRRDWRALGWTAAIGSALALATVADAGAAPLAAFADHLPRSEWRGLSAASRCSGDLRVIDSGDCVQGRPPRRARDGIRCAQIVGWTFTLVVVGMTAWLALRQRDGASTR